MIKFSFVHFCIEGEDCTGAIVRQQKSFAYSIPIFTFDDCKMTKKIDKNSKKNIEKKKF